MSTKSKVSTDYLDDLRKLHGWKQLQTEKRVIITGAKKSGSIGEEITKRLSQWEHFYGDVVISDCPDHLNFNTLIMCHGAMHLDWFEDADYHDLANVIDVNLNGSIRIIQSFVRNTIDAPYRKQIISIGSMAYRAVLNGSAAYCASKAGLAMLIKCLAWELAPKGFDLYSIHPSNTVGAPMSEETITGLMRYRKMSREKATAYWNDSAIRENPLTTGEIADLVEFILSNKAGYLSGSNLELAGGQR